MIKLLDTKQLNTIMFSLWSVLGNLSILISEFTHVFCSEQDEKGLFTTSNLSSMKCFSNEYLVYSLKKKIQKTC